MKKVKVAVRMELSHTFETEIPDDCELSDADEQIIIGEEHLEEAVFDDSVVYYVEDLKTGEIWER